MRRWLLLAAYLPALTFFGQWPLSIDILGTSVYVGLSKSNSSHEVGHESHCHVPAGSSIDFPLTATPSMAILAECPPMLAGEPSLTGGSEGRATGFAQSHVTPTSPPPEPTFQS